MKNIPTINIKAALDNKAVKNNSPQNKDIASVAETMMRLSGKVETCVIPACCAKHDKQYSFIFERQSPDHKFQLAKINIPDTQASKSKALVNILKPQRQNKISSFNANDFDNSGKYCPYCGYNEGFVQCSGCKQNICGARVRTLDNGDRLFACSDSCGSTGKLEPCDYIHGTKKNPGTNLPRNFGRGRKFLNFGGEERKTKKGQKKLISYSGKAKLSFWKK